jgi:hypothetical protein
LNRPRLGHLGDWEEVRKLEEEEKERGNRRRVSRKGK